MRQVTRFLILLLLCTGSTWLKADDLRGDTIDINSYVLRLDFSNFNSKVLTGSATMLIKAKMDNVSSIRLDLLQLTVDSVKGYNISPSYTYNDSVINVNLNTTLNTGDSTWLTVYYHGMPLQMPTDFGGFYWTNNYAFNIGVSFKSDPHNFGKVWFPCFDNFHTRSLYECYINTPPGMKAFCGGLLLDTVQNATNITWHWKLAETIPSYLASVSIAAFKTITDTVHGINSTIPIDIAVVDSVDSGYCKKQFVNLRETFHNLEKYWGPYRWERMGYCIVPFQEGAMEHATNISFSQYFVNPAVSQFFDIGPQTVAHELSHHWFGDLVTCNSAAEMWLNEGWARYNEFLYFEYTYGIDSAKLQWRENHFNVLQKANIDDNGYWALSNMPHSATYGTTTYDKGADALHTLRFLMGDTLFFYSTQNYLNALQFSNGSSMALLNTLSIISDINLTPFFTDWISNPGFTHLSIESSNVYVGIQGYVVQLQIRQRLKHAPNYYTNLPVEITYFNNDMTKIVERVTINGECTSHVASLPFAPVYIAVDFDEQVQDAISDEWDMLNDTGAYTFNIGQMELQVNAIRDSVLFRVEHNWIPADAMYHPIQDLHLNSHRYWTVGGVFNSDFHADATVEYDGVKNDYFDSTFISNSEDSLVMMYRPIQDSDWAFADSFKVNTGPSLNDKKGSITIYNIKSGEYAVAIYDHKLPTDTNNRIPCYLQTEVKPVASIHNFKMFPNPTNESVILTFGNNLFNKVEVFDLQGKLLLTDKILAEQNSVELKLKHILAGTYLITLTELSGIRTTQKLVKQ